MASGTGVTNWGPWGWIQPGRQALSGCIHFVVNLNVTVPGRAWPLLLHVSSTL